MVFYISAKKGSPKIINFEMNSLAMHNRALTNLDTPYFDLPVIVRFQFICWS